MRYNYVKILIITILFSLCYAEENIIFQIDERGYWTGIKKYTVYKDGKCEVKSQMEHGKGSDFVKSGSIDAYRVDNYMKLFRAVGYFDVTNESLGIDRAAGKGAIRVSDGLSVAIKIWDGRNFHEVSEGSIEILADFYPNGPSYSKLLHTKQLIDLIIGDINSQFVNLP